VSYDAAEAGDSRVARCPRVVRFGRLGRGYPFGLIVITADPHPVVGEYGPCDDVGSG
jgi:hypothetical protein